MREQRVDGEVTPEPQPWLADLVEDLRRSSRPAVELGSEDRATLRLLAEGADELALLSGAPVRVIPSVPPGHAAAYGSVVVAAEDHA
jgi:hypothetical protein